MNIFGRKFSDYIRFQKVMLAAVALVGIVRLLVSLGGADDVARWFSMTALLLSGVIVYPLHAHLRAFGAYRELLVLLSTQLALTGAIVTLGIVIAVATGSGNIFSSPVGFAAAARHAAQHLVAGPTIGALLLWIPSSAILFVARVSTRS